MKNKIFILASLFLIVMTNACDDMNDLHQKYLDEGSKVYIGKPDSVIARAGYDCLRLIWTNNADSKIKKTRIVYNYGNDTIVVPFERKVPGYQKDSITLQLEPGDYLFSICNLTEDESLHSIVVEEIRGKVYGESYKNALSTRSYTPAVDGNTVTVTWGDITSDYIYSILKHIDNSGAEPVETEYICENNAYRTVIENVNDGDCIVVASAYIPEENYIGIMESPAHTTCFEIKNGEINRSLYSRYTSIGYDNTTTHAGWSEFWTMFDRDPSPSWLTLISDENSENDHKFPLSFSIDMNATAELDKVEIYHPAGWEFINSSPKRFEVWGTDKVKTDMPKEYWATTAPGDWQNDWYKLGDCVIVQPSGGDNTSVTPEDIAYAQKGFTFTLNPKKEKVRYIRILIYETCDGTVNTGIGELSFYGSALMVK